MGLAPEGAVAGMEAAYRRGFALQAPLAALGLVFGCSAFFATGQWQFLAAGVLIGANWPYTMIALMPTNLRLLGTADTQAGAESVRLIDNWAQLHMVRTGLGALSVLVFCWAQLS